MYLMKITPRGVIYQRRSASQQLQFAIGELGKIVLIIRSEMRARVFQKALGIVFLAIEPIMVAFVYYVLTFIILGSRTTGSEFVAIYVSVVFWRWMSKTVDSSPGLFPSYGAFLKQTNISVVSLVLTFIGIEFVSFLISLAVLVAICTGFGFYPNPAYLLLAFPMLAEFGIILLLTLILSCAGVFIRDLQGFVGSITGIWFYLSPGIYPVRNVPESFLWIYFLNPFAHILPAYQEIMMQGRISNVPVLLLITAVTTVPTTVAFIALQRIRQGFFPFI
jgi:lipopolysaccharide transport system permease protein